MSDISPIIGSDLREAVRRFLASGTEGRRPSQTSNSAIAALDAVESAMRRDISSDPVDELRAAAQAFLTAVMEATPGHAEGTPAMTPYDDEGYRLALALRQPERDISSVTGSDALIAEWQKRLREAGMLRVTPESYQPAVDAKNAVLAAIQREAVEPWRRIVEDFHDLSDHRGQAFDRLGPDIPQCDEYLCVKARALLEGKTNE